MDAAGVETAILSVTAPAVDFGGQAADVALARACNDYLAALVRSSGGRFRFFATLPLPDVAASLREAARALDELGAAGVAMLTNYSGRYLGEPTLVPLFEALNRRAAFVYVHPTNAPCCAGLGPDVLDAFVEFPVNTGRTITSLLWSGTLGRFPDVRFIFSHGGGILPMIAERISAMGYIDPALAARVPDGPAATLARLHVDTASVINPAAMAALRAWLGDERIIYVTDYPRGSLAATRSALAMLDLPEAAETSILRGNALRLLSARHAANPATARAR